MDKLQQLYESFLSNGLISNDTDFNTFSSASQEQLQSLYDAAINKKVLSTKTNFDTFSSAWSVKKKDELQDTSQEDVTVSTTKEEKTPTSLESSEKDRLDDIESESQKDIPTPPIVSVEEKFDYYKFLLKNEEEAKPILENLLKDRGFTVEETGIGNALKVTDKVTNEVTEIDLRPAPITGNTMEQQYEKLDKLFSKDIEVARKSLETNENPLKEEVIKTQYPELYNEKVELENELANLPMISKRSGEIQKRLEEIKDITNNYFDEDKTSAYGVEYVSNKQKINEIDSQIFEIEKKYNDMAERTGYDFENLVNSDGTLQDLKSQKERYKYFNTPYEKALEEISKDTGGTQGSENFFHRLAGLFSIDTEEADEIKEFDDELKDLIISELGDRYNIEKAVLGGMSLDEKEAVIASSKFKLFDKKYKEFESILSDKDKTIEEKKEARDNISALFVDLGLTVADNKIKINPEFQKTVESKEFQEMASDNPFLDTISTFVGATTKLGLQYYVQSWAEGMGMITDLFYEDEQYSPADNFVDSFSKFTSFNYMPSSKEKGLLIDDDGNFDFSIYGTSKAVTETLPFTLGLMLSMKKGKFKMPEKKTIITSIIKNRKNPQKAYENYKLITETYRMGLSESMKTGRDLGLRNEEAALFGNGLALMEGVTGLIMPDIKYFKTETGKIAIKTFSDNLKKAANKKAATQAAYSFIKNIMSEIGEEEAMALYEDLSKTIALTDHKIFSEFLDSSNQKQLLTVTTALSGVLGTIKIPSDIKQGRKDIFNKISENASLLNTMIDDEIESFPEKKDDLLKVRDYINSVNEAVQKSPKNVTFEEVRLLSDKINLTREMESVDESFREPYRKKIEDINKQIMNADKSFTVYATNEEAIASLNEKGIDKPTNKQVLDELDLLTKQKQDAIQEQKTGGISDAKPAEGVQEMETEVREPAVETEEEVTPSTNFIEVDSPIQDNLQENETIVQTREDDNGRVFTTTKQESVRERDGMKVTKFQFNRSDKATDQRNDAFAAEEVALAGTNLEINPEDRVEAGEDQTVTYEISEIREGDTGAAASVKITTFDADGNSIGDFKGDVTLVEKAEGVQEMETEVREPFITEKKKEKVSDAINRPITLTELGGSTLDSPIEGDLYVDGQQVVVEDSEGNITEIGNVDKISDSTLEDLGIVPQESNVKTDSQGNLVVGDDTLVPDRKGIKRDKRGNISRVELRSPDGSITRTLRGANAEDAAYQILLNEAQSTEQEQRINELLEQDEEFQNELRQAEEATETEADKDTTEATGTKEEYVKELKETIDSDPVVQEYLDELNKYRRAKTKNAYDLDEKKITQEQYEAENKRLNQELTATQKRLKMNNKKAGIVTRNENWDKKIKENLPESNISTSEDLNKKLEEGTWGMLTAENPNADIVTDKQNENANKRAEKWLKSKGYSFTKIFGKYGNSEQSYLVDGLTREDAIEFAKEFSQESVATNEGLVYQDGSMNPKVGQSVNINEKDLYSTIKTSDGLVDFKVEYDFSQRTKPTTSNKGLSKLRAAFSQKQMGVGNVNDVTKKTNIEGKAENARKSLAKLLPNVKINTYYNENDYHNAIGVNDKSRGTYSNGVIHINLTRATDTTVAHEVFHALLFDRLGSDAKIQALTKRFVESLSRSQDPRLIQAFANSVYSIEEYKGVENEEIMAELFGTLAGEYKRLKPETKSLIKRFLERVANMIGLKKFTDAEIIDVLNTLSGKIATGQEITTEDLSLFKGGKVVDSPIQALTKKSVGLFDVQYTEANKIKELKDKGLLEEVNDVSEFSGMQATITSPDDMLAGTISIDGRQIFEGGGGIFFVTKYGDVWASGKKGTANTLARMINDSLNKNEGRGILVLTKGTDQKLISSVSGVNSSLAILDIMLDKGLISLSDFRSTVSVAVKKAGGIIKLGGSAKQLKLDVNKYFSDTTTTTFEKRGSVVKDIISGLAQSQSVKRNTKQIIELLGGDTTKKLGVGNTKLSQSFGDLVAGVASEQLTKGLSVGDVYGIIEVNSEVEVIEDSHPSYPFHVRLKDGSKPKLILPKNRQNGSEVLKTSSGNAYKVTQVSVMSGSFNPDIKPIAKKQVSQRPSIEEVVKESYNIGVSNVDTNKFLSELGYTKEEIAEFRENEEGMYKKTGNKVLDWLKKSKIYLTSARAFLPKNVFIAKENKDSAISTEIAVAERAAKRLNKALKNQPDSIYDEVNKLMKGERFDLPKNIAILAKEMREHIDSLSQKLIDSGAIKSNESIENIRKNLGSYLNRSFRVFDDKNWRDKVSEKVVNQAKEYIKKSWYQNEYKFDQAKIQAKEDNMTVDEWIDKKSEQEVNEILNKEDANSFVKSAIEGSKNIKVLKQRKDIPAEILALMGEYNDPSYNYVMSVAKIVNIVENQKYLEKIKDIGEGVFLFKKEQIKRGDPTNYVQISAESNESLAPLNGYYAPKEFVDQMKRENLIDIKDSWFKTIYRGWLKAVGSVKKLKTIYSLGTHGKNVFGNARFMAQNGYVNPKDYNNAYKLLRNEFKNNSNEDLSKKLDEYRRAGVINQNIGLNEIKSMFSGDDSFDVRIEKRTTKQTESKFKKAGKKVDQFLEDLYQAEDDLFKIVAYENEKRDYADIMFDKPYEDLTDSQRKKVDDRVSNIVKNILPNYSRLGGLAKGIKYIPVTGTFISFQLEAYRTAWNTVNLALNEIKSDNSKLRSKGSKRLASLILVEGIKQSLLYFLGTSFLGDDEEEKIKANDVRPFLPEWAKNSDIIVTNSEPGKFTYLNLSSSDPYGGIFQIINAASRGESFSESVTGMLKEFGDPVLSQDIFLSSIDDIIRNKNNYGGNLYEDSDTFFEKSGKTLDRLYKAFEPGTLTSIRKIAKKKSASGMFYETIGQFTGVKPIDVDVSMIMNYKIKDAKESIDNIKKQEYRAEYKAIEENSIGDLFDVYKEVDNKLLPVYEKYNNTINKAMRLGVPITDIDKMMSSKRFSNDDASMMLFYDTFKSSLGD